MREEIIGDCKLILGDCLEVMQGMEAGSVDAVITDPPYGINARTGRVGKSLESEIQWNNGSIQNDKTIDMRDFIIDWSNTKNKMLAVFGSSKIPDPQGYKARLIWDKGESSGMGDLSIPWKPNYDFIYIFGNGWTGKRNSSILKAVNISRICMGRLHPHEKPIYLIEQIIRKTPKQCTVLDPFMGSGTTGVACVQTGRKFIGIEIDEGYFEIACKRIRDACQQMRLPI
jgi:DNA modification methylase